MRSAAASIARVVVLSVALAHSAAAQNLRRASLDSIPMLALDSLNGVATVYFRPTDRSRAVQLQRLLREFLAFYRQRATVDSRMRVALLNATDWARLTSIPYGLPNNSGPPDNLLLAASSPPERVGARALPRGRLGDLLTIGHEGGHLLTWELMPAQLRAAMSADAPPEDVMARLEKVGRIPGWYWEMVANYFTTAFVEANHRVDAAAWVEHLEAIAAVDAPSLCLPTSGGWSAAISRRPRRRS